MLYSGGVDWGSICYPVQLPVFFSFSVSQNFPRESNLNSGPEPPSYLYYW